MNRINILLAVIFCICFSLTSQAQKLRVGDPGVQFDQSKMDENWPQMKEWITAGVRGGIPFIDKLKIKKSLKGGNSADINKAIGKVAKNGGGAILLKNAIYQIDKQINLKSNVCLVGESRDGAICQIDANINENNFGINPNEKGAADDGNGAFKFDKGVKNSGLYRMTIKGGWGKPKFNWNVGSKKNNNELPDNENISIWFMGATDCWIDDITILNSADFPVRCIGKHITMRGLHVDGCFNKQGGCHGYFFLLNGASHNLVTQCFITHLRHISLQGDGVEYNVLYDNNFEQEVSFHTNDDGNNLIENNTITLPADMPGSNLPNYFAIMGPWASFHHISKKPNYIYKNKCLELNQGHDGARPWSDPNILYYGPHFVKPKDHNTNFTEYPKGTPKGGTLYPIALTK